MSVPVQVRVPFRSLDAFEAGFADRITRRALFVDGKSVSAPVGSVVDVEFVLETGARALAFRGIVAWAIAPHNPPPGREAGVGIAVVDVDDDHAATLARVSARPGSGARVRVPGERITQRLRLPDPQPLHLPAARTDVVGRSVPADLAVTVVGPLPADSPATTPFGFDSSSSSSASSDDDDSGFLTVHTAELPAPPRPRLMGLLADRALGDSEPNGRAVVDDVSESAVRAMKDALREDDSDEADSSVDSSVDGAPAGIDSLAEADAVAELLEQKLHRRAAQVAPPPPTLPTPTTAALRPPFPGGHDDSDDDDDDVEASDTLPRPPSVRALPTTREPPRASFSSVPQTGAPFFAPPTTAGTTAPRPPIAPPTTSAPPAPTTPAPTTPTMAWTATPAPFSSLLSDPPPAPGFLDSPTLDGEDASVTGEGDDDDDGTLVPHSSLGTSSSSLNTSGSSSGSVERPREFIDATPAPLFAIASLAHLPDAPDAALPAPSGTSEKPFEAQSTDVDLLGSISGADIVPLDPGAAVDVAHAPEPVLPVLAPFGELDDLEDLPSVDAEFVDDADILPLQESGAWSVPTAALRLPTEAPLAAPPTSATTSATTAATTAATKSATTAATKSATPPSAAPPLATPLAASPEVTLVLRHRPLPAPERWPERSVDDDAGRPLGMACAYGPRGQVGVERFTWPASGTKRYSGLGHDDGTHEVGEASSFGPDDALFGDAPAAVFDDPFARIGTDPRLNVEGVVERNVRAAHGDARDDAAFDDALASLENDQSHVDGAADVFSATASGEGKDASHDGDVTVDTVAPHVLAHPAGGNGNGPRVRPSLVPRASFVDDDETDRSLKRPR